MHAPFIPIIRSRSKRSRADANKPEWFAGDGLGVHAASRAPLNKGVGLLGRIATDAALRAIRG